jgi:hypothetical protein
MGARKGTGGGKGVAVPEKKCKNLEKRKDFSLEKNKLLFSLSFVSPSVSKIISRIKKQEKEKD